MPDNAILNDDNDPRAVRPQQQQQQRGEEGNNDPLAFERDADDDDLPRQDDNNNDVLRLLQRHRRANITNNETKRSYGRFFTYSMLSVTCFVSMIYWAFYTRQQFYLAMVYLASSKLAHVIVGNFLICCTMSFFLTITKLFLNGLRSIEQEAISDGLRWSLMETALAITLFREEVSRHLVFWFLSLALVKCLHWAVEYRGRHMQQTDVVFIPPTVIETEDEHPPQHPVLGAAKSGLVRRHLGFLSLSFSLLLLDLFAVLHCAKIIAMYGPSVHILFGFEAAILLVSAISTLMSYVLHVVDYVLHSRGKSWHGKSTISFAFEVASEACKFIFYVCFFTIIFTYYGLPFNLIRDVWVSYVNLRRKVESFRKYRQLTFNMNEQFDDATEEELIACGHECIICRDHMKKGKKLTCGHVFHFFCLRDWLQQQQTCPTCRAEIPTKSTKTEREQRGRQWRWIRRQIAEARAEREVAPQQQQQQQQPIVEETNAPTTTSNQPLPQSVENAPTDTIGDSEKQQQQQQQQQRLLLQTSSSSLQSLKEPKADDAHAVLDKVIDDEGVDLSPFPCLYRVTNASGAKVYSITSNQPIKEVRIVPPNKMILCLEMDWFSESKILSEHPLVNSSDEDGLDRVITQLNEQEDIFNNLSGKMILRMPDGWVSESDLERIAVPLRELLTALPGLQRPTSSQD
jgi:E3 ubiquitin-protein ligase synoviolin